VRGADWARLVALAAIWGGSFVFMRVVAPSIGPIATAQSRVLLGGAALALWLAVTGVALNWRRWWRQYLTVGIANSAVPFLLFAFAALAAPASHLAIVNALTPVFGAIVAAVWLGDRLRPVQAAGMVLSFTGVVIVALRGASLGAGAWWAYLAGGCAAACYAVAGVYIKRHVSAASPQAIAGAAQLSAAAVLAPLLVVAPPHGPINIAVAANVLALGVIASGIAFLLYYRLIADIGPTRAMSVTFLIPVFGMLWGALFIDERLTVGTLAGAALVLAGTALVVRARRPVPVPAAAD
jgi:drug/metabolite transporter (DMT)-like permease